jgi:hypothetical protein
VNLFRQAKILLTVIIDKQMKRLTYILTLLLLALSACRKENDDITPDNPGGDDALWRVSVMLGADDDGDVIFAAKASYEKIKVEISGYQSDTDGKILVKSGAEWLQLKSDTLADDCIVGIATVSNSDGLRRTSTIKFSSSLLPEKTAEVLITQLSASDDDNNGGNAEAVCYVGYGYNIFKAYESPMSVKKTKPVLDLAKLKNTAGVLGFVPLQDCHLARTETKYFCNTSIFGFAEELTASQTKSSVSINGCREDCKRLESRCSGEAYENNFGRGCILKTVASKVIDRGALLELQKIDEESVNTSQYNVPWSSDFAKRLTELKNSANNQKALQSVVDKIINEYGTHIVIQADLGGRIDYSFSMAKMTSINSIQELREEIDYTFGRAKASERTPEFQNEPSSDKNSSLAISIQGGGKSERETLQRAVSKLGRKGQLDIDDINRWIGSINPSPNMVVGINESLDVVHFELIPIWELVPSRFRNIFLNTVLELVNESDNKIDAEKLHIDIYDIDLKQKELVNNFKTDGSLCKILYIDDVPILEVCSEYVPKIRTDKRVTVIYPIFQNRIKMSQGLFIGDGNNQPAIVGFSNDYCYVYPIDSLPMGRVLDHIYYIRGNLLLENYGLTALTKKREVQDDMFYFRKGGINYQHPIVKIGSKFWTRRDINHNLGLTNSPNSSSTKTFDVLKDEIVYARFWHDVNRSVRQGVSWIWGDDRNGFYPDKPYTKWYFPRGGDIENLYKYLGFNPKSLFIDGVSGFEAKFNGYYGLYDIINEKSFADGANKVRYKEEYNIFACRNGSSDTDAILLLLSKDYKMFTIPFSKIDGWGQNYYPVRPVRGYMYEYPSLSTIKNKIN